ncbi:MAG: hydroxymethylbilane synthase [Candidatus Acidiferrales bacterium]
MKPLRIGTRGSTLALWQANDISARLAELHGIKSELVRIRTSGDHFQTAAIAQIGTKGVFIKELEDALLAGTIDLAVHSMKDVPIETPKGLCFPAITKREDVRDCLISHRGLALDKLPAGARVGTSSLRRQAQLRACRPDLEAVELRGNVDTRIKKVEAGEYDAIILAKAGVDRLGLSEKITEILHTTIMLPAVGQGALGIETREGDSETSRLAAALDDEDTRSCVTAERALLRELEGGCQVPLGAWARLGAGGLLLEACVLSPDGKESLRRELDGPPEDADKIGRELGQILLEAGADRILRLAGRSVGNG